MFKKGNSEDSQKEAQKELRIDQNLIKDFLIKFYQRFLIYPSYSI
jgi:hypothetical protein